MSERLYHFECPECGYDDAEAGVLATEKQCYCGLCAGDTGKEVLIRKRLAAPLTNPERSEERRG